MVARHTDGLLSLHVDRHIALGSRMLALQASSNQDWNKMYGLLEISDSRSALSEYSFLRSETLLWRGCTSLMHLVWCFDSLNEVVMPMVLTSTPLIFPNFISDYCLEIWWYVNSTYHKIENMAHSRRLCFVAREEIASLETSSYQIRSHNKWCGLTFLSSINWVIIGVP